MTKAIFLRGALVVLIAAMTAMAEDIGQGKVGFSSFFTAVLSALIALRAFIDQSITRYSRGESNESGQ